MNIQLEASKQYINLLTNVDLNVRTTTKDLLDFIKTGMKYYKCEKPELTDESLMSKLEKQWEDYKSDAESWAIYHKQERKRAAARARYDSEKAKNKYETVTKPRMQAKKQEVIEQKLALLHEYKEKYGVECKPDKAYDIFYGEWEDPDKGKDLIVDGQIVVKNASLSVGIYDHLYEGGIIYQKEGNYGFLGIYWDWCLIDPIFDNIIPHEQPPALTFVKNGTEGVLTMDKEFIPLDTWNSLTKEQQNEQADNVIGYYKY